MNTTQALTGRGSRRAAIALLAAALTLAAGCRKESTNHKSSTRPIGGAYTGTLDASSKFVVGSGQVVAIKTIRKDLAAANDPLQTRFEQGLHPQLKQYCSPCHAGQNAFPFASPGVDLAYATVKKYVTADPETSKIMLNIRSGHNGVKPEWADTIGPLLKDLVP